MGYALAVERQVFLGCTLLHADIPADGAGDGAGDGVGDGAAQPPLACGVLAFIDGAQYLPVRPAATSTLMLPLPSSQATRQLGTALFAAATAAAVAVDHCVSELDANGTKL